MYCSFTSLRVYRFAGTLPIALALGLIAGCGSGGGGANGILPGSGGSPLSPGRGDTATARFQVDVKTGLVSITPLTGRAAKSGRAIFTGSTIQFNSSTLLDQPGDVGRRVLNVSITNRSGEPIGRLPNGTATGLRLLFSDFTNVGAFSDPRPRVNVTTIAGTGAASSTDGPALSATFNLPDGVAADSTGAVYVTDSNGNRIRKIANGLVSNLAGSGAAGGNNAAGDAATFNAPYGIAINQVDGAVIVTDLLGNRTRRITPDGSVTLVAGTGAAGSTNGPGNLATFNRPTGVAVSSAGTIYVVDTVGHKVRKIELSGDPTVAANYMVSTLAGTGSPGFMDGVGTVAQFNTPYGIALGSDNAIYVGDSNNNRVRRITLFGEVTTVAGTGAAGSADGTGEAATFRAPFGVAWSGSALIVSELSNFTMRQIRLKDPGAAPGKSDSWYVQLLAGNPLNTGATDGDGNAARFNSPRLLGTGIGGALYVPDGSNNKVRKIVPANGFFPVGIATGSVPTEKVQLSNADGLIPVPANGTYVNFINYEGDLAAGATSATKNWSFIVPNGVTAFEFTVTVEAASSSLAPPESVNNGSGGGAGSPKVRVRTLTGGPQSGYVDGSFASARFYQPYSIAVDRAGILYVGDSNDAIRRIGTNGIVSTVAGSIGTGSSDGPGSLAQFNSPRGITVNPEGTVIYVADQGNNRVRRIYNSDPTGDPTNPNSWYVTTVAGTGASGGTYTSARGNVATFNLPFGIVLGTGDTVYVTELNGNRIRRLRFLGGDASQPTQWLVTLLAGDISATNGVTGDVDGTGSAARFNNPLALALDSAGKLYVCDQNNHRIRTITPDGVTSTLAGGISGDVPAFGYVDGPGASARFYFPFGIAVDSAGFVYVCDYYNYRIRRITPGGVVTTIAGTGASGATDGPGNTAQFATPDNIAVDGSGTLYVSDRFNHAIRLIERVIGSQ